MTINYTDLIFNKSLNELQLPLFSFIFGMIPHKQDAEDILQKTNVILIEKQNEFDPKLGSLKSWAFNIARFQIMGYRTLSARSKICFSNELTEVMADEAIDYDTLQIQRNALNKWNEYKNEQPKSHIQDIGTKLDGLAAFIKKLHQYGDESNHNVASTDK